MKATLKSSHDRMSVTVKDGKRWARLNFSRSGVNVTSKGLPNVARQLRDGFVELNAQKLSFGRIAQELSEREYSDLI